MNLGKAKAESNIIVPNFGGLVLGGTEASKQASKVEQSLSKKKK